MGNGVAFLLWCCLRARARASCAHAWVESLAVPMFDAELRLACPPAGCIGVCGGTVSAP
jgi:hypothetical protein